MAMEHFFEGTAATGNAPSLQNRKSGLDSDNINGCFDCNICLEFAHDPVVTLCGHLYCWPCIYKWLHFQRTSTASEQLQQQCPVCKANVSLPTLVPLFGRGEIPPNKTEVKDKSSHTDLVIPRRPPNCGVHALTMSHSTPPLPRRSYPDPSPMFNLGGTTATSVFNPIMGMFGEMVYARVFGNPEVSSFTYPNSNYAMVNGSPRMRRQEMQADKSLSRVSIFLFCCLVLCFLLF